MQGMIIWDLHCHPDDTRLPGRNLTEKVENLLTIADRVGIERLGLLLRADGKEREVEQALERHRRRVFAFLWMTLWNDTVEANIAKLNRWVADGPMVGMKLAGTDGVCSLPIYFPIFERAARLQAGIFVHAWLQMGGNPPRPGGLLQPNESKPQDVAALAARLPETPIICGHGGGDWEPGIRAIRAAKNVLFEVSGSFPTRGMVEMAVRELGAERIVYGSDICGRSFASQLAKVHGADVADRDKELIFSGNLKRVLTPMLKAKGLL